MKFLLKNFERPLFYFLFFAIPFQARKVLYSLGWYFNEWQSISFYLTDLILFALFGFWVYRSIQSWQIFNFKFLISKQLSNYLIIKLPNYDLFLLGFLIAALISVKNSSDSYSGFFLWLKLVEFAAFYFYLKSYAVRKFNFVKILYVLVIGGSFQAIVAIVQFLKQSDLGLRWLGESVFGPHMTGVASFYIDSGLKVIRAYGTTPHPNVLAAYLFLGIFASYFIYIYQNGNDKNYNSLIYHKIIKYWWAWYPLTLFGLFFTFSRTIIFLWVAGFLLRVALIAARSKFREQFWRTPVLKTRLIRIILVTLLTVVVFSFLYWPEVSARIRLSSQEEAVQLRAFYNRELLGGEINLFGIGLGDFTGWLMEQNPNLPRYVYQPVHNIYLLIYSEVGVLGFVLFMMFLAGLFYEFVKKTRLQELWHYSFLLVVTSVLFIGLFDHFLLTIQQGRFVFWLAIALLTFIKSNDIIRTQR